METASLTLVIVQGPRAGEIFEFRPGSTARIGRIVRGNNLTIKDDGISSKHLTIGSDCGRWTLQDLDSSNGTSLNSISLPPFKPFHLGDGDIIKLGESTSILVKIAAASQLRRNPRRRVNERTKTLETEKKSEMVEGLLEVSAAPNPRRGRPRRARVLTEIPETEGEAAHPSNSKGVAGNRALKSEDCGILENLCTDAVELGVEQKKTRGGGRRRKNAQENNVKEESTHEIDVGLNSQEEAIRGNSIAVFDSGNQEVDIEVIHVQEEAEKLSLEDNCGHTLNEAADVKQSKDLHKGQEIPNLEKMSLGEWFDFIEVHLPKQIVDATEEIIEGMRVKAQRVGEYIVHQKKYKTVGTVG
ncbi:hypothetical protein K2173_018941 [Erythroxylum novogranatense]|uniref:FHA domain-containing protein n=1 Tax=Erythroxylum novogranatense TaxID=1862640 RepID=A0AAV8SSB8_9ROSI|nr:hypothetical protein K2173_018941 [Erythroxylum novogranatense]